MTLRRKINLLTILTVGLFLFSSTGWYLQYNKPLAAEVTYQPIDIKSVKSATDIIDSLHNQQVDTQFMGKDNLNGTISWGTSRLMLGYVYAYEATGDTKYLDWFDAIGNDVMAQRDDAVQRTSYDGIDPVWSIDSNATNSWVTLKDVNGADLIKLTSKDYNNNDQLMVAVYTDPGTNKQYMIVRTNPKRPLADRQYICYREITYPSSDPLRPAKNYVDLINRIWPFEIRTATGGSYGGRILAEEVVNPTYQGQTDDGLSWKIYGAPALWDLSEYMDPANKVDFSGLTAEEKMISTPPADGYQMTDRVSGNQISENCFSNDELSELPTGTVQTIDISTIPFYSFTPYIASQIHENGIIDLSFSDYARVVYAKNGPDSYKQKADSYLAKVKKNLDYYIGKDLWRQSADGSQGWFIVGPAPYHKMSENEIQANNRMALFLANYVNLYEITKDDQYKTMPEAFINFWKARAGIKDGGYIWCYSNRWDSENIDNCIKEDYSHAGLDFDFFLRAYNNQIGINQDDINKFLVTINTVAKTSDGYLTQYVDGTGNNHTWPLWLDLAQFDKGILQGEVDGLNKKIAGANTGAGGLGWGDIYWFGDTARWIKYYCDKGECVGGPTDGTTSNLPSAGTGLIILVVLSGVASVGLLIYLKRYRLKHH